MAKLFDKDITKGVIGNAVFQVFWNGVSAMISYYTAHSAYLNGVPFYLVIIIGVVLFFLLSLTLFLFKARRHKQAKDEPLTEDALDKLDHEEIVKKKDERIAELEREKVAFLKDGRNEDAVLIRQYKSSSERLTQEHQTLRAELDKLKWLRESADRDKSNINNYVYIIFHRVDYAGLDDPYKPYIEIYFKIINASVYRITISKNIEDGAVYLNQDHDLNSNDAKIDGSLQNISRDENELRWLVIKQRLAPGEAERIKNPQPGDKLIFGRLHLNVKGKNGYYETDWQRLHLPSEIPIVKTADELIADYTARLNKLSAAYETHTRNIRKLSEVLGRANEIDFIFSKGDISVTSLDIWLGFLNSALADCYGSLADEKYRHNEDSKRVPERERERDIWLQHHQSRLSSLIEEEEAQLALRKEEVVKQHLSLVPYTQGSPN
jgi:hypothetical protein